MTGNEVSILIFMLIIGSICIVLSFKYNKDFHSNYKDQSFGSGEQGGAMLFINVMKLLPYWVYKIVLFLVGISIFSLLIFLLVKK